MHAAAVVVAFCLRRSSRGRLVVPGADWWGESSSFASASKEESGRCHLGGASRITLRDQQLSRPLRAPTEGIAWGDIRRGWRFWGKRVQG